jgi:hypothetical protein
VTDPRVPIAGTLRGGGSCVGHTCPRYRGHDRARGAVPNAGESLQAQARQIFHRWHRVRDGTLTPMTLASYMWPMRQEVGRLLEAGQTCGVPKTQEAYRAILKQRQALCATSKASPRTTPRSGPSVAGYSGTKAALGPRALRAPDLSKR